MGPVFVSKPSGGWRFCLDFRGKRIVPDSYPLPLLWDNVRQAAHYTFYITLDLNNGFWNRPLEKSTKPLTALVTHRGQFEFNVLPFGIKNAPGEFQRAVDAAFGDLYGKGVLTYIDDIVIYGNEIHDVLDVLIRCLNYGFFIKMRKCEFLKPRVELLGHVISCGGV